MDIVPSYFVLGLWLENPRTVQYIYFKTAVLNFMSVTVGKFGYEMLLFCTPN